MPTVDVVRLLQTTLETLMSKATLVTDESGDNIVAVVPIEIWRTMQKLTSDWS